MSATRDATGHGERISDDADLIRGARCEHRPEDHPLEDELPAGAWPAPRCQVPGCVCIKYKGRPA